ncbi:hypothetical protein DFAR_4040019 [Desulfarculales bacterium]
MGYQYSWLCELYREWSGKLGLIIRQEHRAGEKMFIDYVSQIVDVMVPLAGKVEVGVQLMEKWMLAALRKRTFVSLAELN